jgi:7-cyano-7-deazaguanine synthase
VCGIVGAVFSKTTSLQYALSINNERGRDAWGAWTSNGECRFTKNFSVTDLDNEDLMVDGLAIANLRAEPTTEYVKEKHVSDVQPYQVGDWIIVHNGTIANDKEICRVFHFKPETRIDSWVIAALLDHYSNPDFDLTDDDVFQRMLEMIVGSYAIIAINQKHQNVLRYAVNYRPLYKHIVDGGLILSSVPLNSADELIKPYSWGSVWISRYGVQHLHGGTLYPEKSRKQKVLVVISGGLDSTVAAADLKNRGYDVTLLHFDYGCRATTPERRAVEAVALRLNVPLDVVTTSVFTDIIKGSRLTNTKAEFADGEAGAEYAHEWVPARNTILLSIALGIAESRGFDAIALGANLEEAGAYPDNEPEFLRQFNKLIPFAVGDGKRIEILTPVGNLMKHEIVKLGLEIKAPMELTWSCYNADDKHCGHCGPCFMRKVAFEINGATDPVFQEA